MTDWLVGNAEWVFGGIGIAVPIAIIGWFLTRKSISRKQIQKSGNNSINIQVGNDLSIGNSKPKSSTNEE